MDTHNAIMDGHLNCLQKNMKDGDLIVQSIRDDDWDLGSPTKPVLDQMDPRKRDDEGELALDGDRLEQKEDNVNKMEITKMDHEVKKIEHTKALRV